MLRLVLELPFALGHLLPVNLEGRMHPKAPKPLSVSMLANAMG